MVFQGLRNNIVGANMDREMAARWFPFIATLALFIFFSNLIGFIPLPTNTDPSASICSGWHMPAFSLYAATANLSIPLVLALVVFVSYTVEGVRAKGPIGYLKGLIPAGVTGADGRLHLRARAALEPHAAALALDSSVRQHPRRPPDHPVHGRCAGGGARGRAIGWFTLPFGVLLFVFEVGLVAALQAFIFATLTAIYLGGAVADNHYQGGAIHSVMHSSPSSR